MNETTTTAHHAVKDFAVNIWPGICVSERKENKRAYLRAYRIIWDNTHKGAVTQKRAAWLLETYGRGRYAVETTFKILTDGQQ